MTEVRRFYNIVGPPLITNLRDTILRNVHAYATTRLRGRQLTLSRALRCTYRDAIGAILTLSNRIPDARAALRRVLEDQQQRSQRRIFHFSFVKILSYLRYTQANLHS